MHDEHYPQIRGAIKRASRDCHAKHPEWFAAGNVRSIERSVLKECKPFLLDALQLSFGDGVLERIFQKAQPESE